MLHLSTIETTTLELLMQLMQHPAFQNMRLAGGTALALQIGHRKSVDLDLFGSVDFESLDWQEVFADFDSVIPIKRSKNINVFAINSIKVDFVNYNYPWLNNILLEKNIRMASLSDIAAMKLAAITGRGSKKDFVDIYFLLERFTLDQLLEFYQEKYRDGSSFLVLKSLSWFEDADKDADLNMIADVSWEFIKQEISKQLQNYFLDQ
jgi:predicted nucleotidyltransferase component of viral defense system